MNSNFLCAKQRPRRVSNEVAADHRSHRLKKLVNAIDRLGSAYPRVNEHRLVLFEGETALAAYIFLKKD
jgi:16S rRNA C967 or C1407 C5-methylase (RsmB/RsmF family)